MEKTIGYTDGNGWFQLYVDDDLKAGLEMAKRAALAGYKNLIFTVDVPDLGRRPRELRQDFKVPWWPTVTQFFDCAVNPAWSLSMLLNGGAPRPENAGTKISSFVLLFLQAQFHFEKYSGCGL